MRSWDLISVTIKLDITMGLKTVNAFSVPWETQVRRVNQFRLNEVIIILDFLMLCLESIFFYNLINFILI